MNIPILAYHKVNNSFELGINRISVHAFEKQIKYLSEHNYFTISLSDFITNNFQSTDHKSVIITFDDADESVYKNCFPILTNYGFKATLFVISNFVGKYNSWDYNFFGNRSKHLNKKQIQKLAQNGWEIGSHTHTHQDLTTLSDEQIFLEMEKSKLLISEIIDKPVDYLSFPFNRYNEKVIKIAKQVGYKGSCTLSNRKYYNQSFRNYVIPRLGIYRIDSITAFKNKLSNSCFELAKQRVISFFSLGTIIYRKAKK